MTDHVGAAERARHLMDIRDALRAYETSHLAAVASHLAETTQTLLEVSGRLSRPLSEDWLTLERAAVELGFLDEEGKPRKEAFSLAMRERKVPRAELSRTRIYYRREDLDNLLRGLRS